MTGSVRGLVTRMSSECSPGLIQIWCGLHQLDLVMQGVYAAAFDEQFYSTLTALIGYLRRQQNLITEMRSTCPKVATTRWISMYSTASWLIKHRERIMQYLDDKRPPCSPDASWWIFLHAVAVFSSESKIVFTSLQGLSTLVCEQRNLLKGLIDTYARMSGMEGPLCNDQIQEIVSQEPCVMSGAYILTERKCRLYLESLGMWNLQALDNLDSNTKKLMFSSVGRLFVDAAARISDIVCERDSCNAPSDPLPPVLPEELSSIDMRQLVNTVQQHRARLLPVFSQNGIEQICDDFRLFQRAFREEPVFQEAVKARANPLRGFSEAWACTNNRFPNLQKFCGGLASAFPNTATVESDFSVIGWEKDECRTSLTDFSLEGILHAKQYQCLKNLEQQLHMIP